MGWVGSGHVHKIFTQKNKQGSQSKGHLQRGGGAVLLPHHVIQVLDHHGTPALPHLPQIPGSCTTQTQDKKGSERLNDLVKQESIMMDLRM